MEFLEPIGKKHTEYAKEIMKEYTFKIIRDTQEILYYENGVYRNGTETLINSECESRIPNCIPQIISLFNLLWNVCLTHMIEI